MRAPSLLAASLLLGCATAAQADVIYSNLSVNGSMGAASRQDAPGVIEIESADDFLLTSTTRLTSATVIGLLVPGPLGGAPSISSVDIEIYRVFPADSDVGRTSGSPVFSTSRVPTRVNSPSDVALLGRSSSVPGQLSFSSSVIASSFTVANTIQAGGIHPLPTVTTGGNGPLTGQEVQFNINFTTPIDLPADHYFFVPQVTLTSGAQFYWLSAARPIVGTPFAPDLQAWIRDGNLDPDWLRIGTDIVGGTTPPTFDLAFALIGTRVPEPSGAALLLAALVGFGLVRRRRTAEGRSAA